MKTVVTLTALALIGLAGAARAEDGSPASFDIHRKDAPAVLCPATNPDVPKCLAILAQLRGETAVAELLQKKQ